MGVYWVGSMFLIEVIFQVPAANMATKELHIFRVVPSAFCIS
jgi:hypothetical protein